MKLSDLRISVYQIDEYRDIVDVTLERVGQREGPDLWAIREKGCVLNKKGEWEFEPIPSSRTDAFFRRCRWKSAEAALEFWVKKQCRSRFEHYRQPSEQL